MQPSDYCNSVMSSQGDLSSCPTNDYVHALTNGLRAIANKAAPVASPSMNAVTTGLRERVDRYTQLLNNARIPGNNGTQRQNSESDAEIARFEHDDSTPTKVVQQRQTHTVLPAASVVSSTTSSIFRLSVNQRDRLAAYTASLSIADEGTISSFQHSNSRQQSIIDLDATMEAGTDHSSMHQMFKDHEKMLDEIDVQLIMEKNMLVKETVVETSDSKVYASTEIVAKPQSRPHRDMIAPTQLPFVVGTGDSHSLPLAYQAFLSVIKTECQILYKSFAILHQNADKKSIASILRKCRSMIIEEMRCVTKRVDEQLMASSLNMTVPIKVADDTIDKQRKLLNLVCALYKTSVCPRISQMSTVEFVQQLTNIAKNSQINESKTEKENVPKNLVKKTHTKTKKSLIPRGFKPLRI